MAQNSRCCSALRGTSLGERAAPRWEGADPAPASIVGSPRGHRWLCSQLQSLPSIQHWGTQWELVPEHIKAFPAGTQGFSPMTAAVGLTASLQPWGGALPRAELNLELSNPGKCFPSAPGGLIFLFCSRAGYYFPLAHYSVMALGAEQQRSVPNPISRQLIPSCASRDKPCRASRGFYLLGEITQPSERVGSAQKSGSNEYFFFNCFSRQRDLCLFAQNKEAVLLIQAC